MKNELVKLYTLLRSWGNLYNDNMTISASVVVQNMAFSADEWSWDEFEPYLDILKQMKGLNKNDHVMQWAYDEAQMIVDSHFMSLELEEQELLDLKNDCELNGLENQSYEG